MTFLFFLSTFSSCYFSDTFCSLSSLSLYISPYLNRFIFSLSLSSVGLLFLCDVTFLHYLSHPWVLFGPISLPPTIHLPSLFSWCLAGKAFVDNWLVEGVDRCCMPWLRALISSLPLLFSSSFSATPHHAGSLWITVWLKCEIFSGFEVSIKHW